MRPVLLPRRVVRAEQPADCANLTRFYRSHQGCHAKPGCTAATGKQRDMELGITGLGKMASPPVIGLSLLRRIGSRDEVDYADKLLSARRNQLGGHAIKTES